MSQDRSNNQPDRKNIKARADKNNGCPTHKSLGKTGQQCGSADALDLDYISTWDTICYDPTDVFMHSSEVIFDDGSFDVGEPYPRGV